jgi:hypothetical protein
MDKIRTDEPTAACYQYRFQFNLVINIVALLPDIPLIYNVRCHKLRFST